MTELVKLGRRGVRLDLEGEYDLPARSRAPVSRGTLAGARSVAEALFSGDEPVSNDRLDWLVKDLEDFLGRSQRGARTIFWLCTTAVTMAGPLLSLTVGFQQRTVAERRRILERMERSAISPALLAMKAILSMIYFEHPDAAREIGADGECKGPPA